MKLNTNWQDLFLKWAKNFLVFVVLPTLIAVLIASQTGDVALIKGALLGTGVGSLIDFTKKLQQALE